MTDTPRPMQRPLGLRERWPHGHVGGGARPTGTRRQGRAGAGAARGPPGALRRRSYVPSRALDAGRYAGRHHQGEPGPAGPACRPGGAHDRPGFVIRSLVRTGITRWRGGPFRDDPPCPSAAASRPWSGSAGAMTRARAVRQVAEQPAMVVPSGRPSRHRGGAVRCGASRPGPVGTAARTCCPLSPAGGFPGGYARAWPVRSLQAHAGWRLDRLPGHFRSGLIGARSRYGRQPRSSCSFRGACAPASLQRTGGRLAGRRRNLARPFGLASVVLQHRSRGAGDGGRGKPGRAGSGRPPAPR